jgi:hypothetical protein
MLRSIPARLAWADELPDNHLQLTLSLDSAQATDDLALLSLTAARSPSLRQRLLDLGDIGAHLRFVLVEAGAGEPATHLRYRVEFSGGLSDLVLAAKSLQPAA